MLVNVMLIKKESMMVIFCSSSNLLIAKVLLGESFALLWGLERSWKCGKIKNKEILVLVIMIGLYLGSYIFKGNGNFIFKVVRY